MLQNLLFASLSLVLTFGAHTAQGATTYTLQSYPALQNGLTLSGSITTDGTIGTITSSDITGWSINVIGQPGFSLTPDNSNLTQSSGSFLTTTSGQLEISGTTDSALTFFSNNSTGAFLVYDFHRTIPEFSLYIAGLNAEDAIHSFLWNNSILPTPFIIATTQTIPEPGSLTLALLGFACLAMAQCARRRHRVVCRFLFFLSNPPAHA